MNQRYHDQPNRAPAPTRPAQARPTPAHPPGAGRPHPGRRGPSPAPPGSTPGGRAAGGPAPTTPLTAAVAALKAGGLIIVRDDEGRENEGDLVGAAEHVTPEMIAFMAVYGRGLVCQSITAETAARLELPPQTAHNTESNKTAFTITVDAATDITTGISAADRARTAAILADPASTPDQLVRPGHMFPLIARPNGVLQRPGHTEASVDLARLAGCVPSGIICEILNDDGTMARGPQLETLAAAWNIPLVTVSDLIEYRTNQQNHKEYAP